MTIEDNAAEVTAQAEQAPEQVEQTAPSEEKPDLTPEQKANLNEYTVEQAEHTILPVLDKINLK